MSCSNTPAPPIIDCGEAVQIRAMIKIPTRRLKGRLRKGKKAHCKIVTGRIACDQPQGRQLKFANRFTKLQDCVTEYYEAIAYADKFLADIEKYYNALTHSQRRKFRRESKTNNIQLTKKGRKLLK